METLYLVIVGVLFILAISDLVIGVSNDAVNFLNSALGAKVAPFKMIMFIASIGVFVGATFSSGMMEVARKGIFNPEHFYFSEIMIIFLAVMFTDILLLDGFNTLGMPTSTTVSIVFELLGSAVAISLLKIAKETNALQLYDYINTAKAVAIISGILLSVVVAFSVGMIVQFISRMVFTFNYDKKIKFYGSIFGGIAITAITYFILVKGVKGAVFMTAESKDWIKGNSLTIIVASFAAWTIILQLLYWLFKINILKVIVLVGTFALAMAFAGNDLVNFIGVPLAGFQSYKHFIAQGGVDPNAVGMAFLAGKVKTDTYLLVLAGLIMVVTLFFSKKARRVVKTSIDLSRQDKGEERFGSSTLARSIVRATRNMTKGVNYILPSSVVKTLERRFDQSAYNERVAKLENPPAFDLIRAAVNLVVASVLIALATSFKLPLSTTYVTFMVAMGTSLADRAWGRESAVYRITGVLSVIGGWFLTALIAFTVAFVMANIIAWGGTWAIGILSIAAAYIIYRTHRHHKKREEEEEAKLTEEEQMSEEEKILMNCLSEVKGSIKVSAKVYFNALNATMLENVRDLRKTVKNTKKQIDKIEALKSDIYFNLPKGDSEEAEAKDMLLYQMTDSMLEGAWALNRLVKPLYNHVDNNHKPFTESQQTEVAGLVKVLTQFYTIAEELASTDDGAGIDELDKVYTELIAVIRQIRVSQLKRLKTEKTGTKVSLLYSDMLHETITIIEYNFSLLNTFAKYCRKEM